MTIENTSGYNQFLMAHAHFENNDSSMVIDLQSFEFPDRQSQKNIKEYLFRTIREHQHVNQLTLKVSTTYASIVKYALNAGFNFIKANSSEAIMAYQPSNPRLFEQLKEDTLLHKKELARKGLSERANGIQVKLFETDNDVSERVDLTPFENREKLPRLVSEFDITKKSTLFEASSNNKNESIDDVLDIRLYPTLKNLLHKHSVEAFLGTRKEMECYYRRRGINILYEFQIPSSAVYFLAESKNGEQMMIMAGLVGKDNLIAQMLTLKYAAVDVEKIEIIGTFEHFSNIVENDLKSLFNAIPEIVSGINILVVAGCGLKETVNSMIVDKYSDNLNTPRIFSGDILSLVYTPMKNSENQIRGFITLDLNYGEIVEHIITKLLSKTCCPYIFSGGACGYIPQNPTDEMPEIGTRISVMKSMNEEGEIVSCSGDCTSVHLQVPSIFVETYEWLDSAKSRGSTVDIETFYILRALQTHTSNCSYPVISDLGCFVSDWVGEKPLRDYSKVFNQYSTVLENFIENAFSHAGQRNYDPSLQKRNDVLIDCLQNDPRTPHLKMLDSSLLNLGIDSNDLQLFKDSIIQNNPDKTLKDLFHNKKWDLDYFNKSNTPVVVGEVKNKEDFSHRKNDIGLRFLDLPIHMPGQGWRIPQELEQFSEIIEMAAKYERVTNPNFEKLNYVYITVDQGVVDPEKAQRRVGWHGDSFMPIDTRKTDVDITCDRVYVIANNCPTPFVGDPCSFEGVNLENWDEINECLKTYANDLTPQFSPLFTLLRLDPYCIHNVGFNNGKTPVFRTFVKISFSEREYRHLGNCHNPLFKYHWPTVPRKNVPYSRKVLSESAHREDRDSFEMVNPNIIDFSKNQSKVKWTKSEIFTAIKKTKIRATEVEEGNILHTYDEDFLVTILVSKKGDWKISPEYGIEYFLSKEQLDYFYDEVPNQPGSYTSKAVQRRMVELTKDVRLIAPWGTLQYAQAGDYICSVNNEVYAIPKPFMEDFEIVE